MPNIELGVFVFFAAIPFLSLIFLGKIRNWGLIGGILFIGIGIVAFVFLAALALIMFSQWDVTITEVQKGYAESEIGYNASGGVVSNVTTTIPNIEKQTPIINQFHNEFGYFFFGLTILFGVLYFKIMATGGV